MYHKKSIGKGKSLRYTLHTMFFAFLLIFASVFALICWKKNEWGLTLLFLLLPTYLIRFHIGPLPSTVLEIMIWIIVGVWAITETGNWKLETKNSGKSNTPIFNFQFLISKNKLLTTGIFLFLLAATVSIFTSLDIRAAAGEWKAFYVEPILIFFIVISFLKSKSNVAMKQCSNELKALSHCHIVTLLLVGLIICGLITSILAIYQHFTGFLVPHAFWANQNTYRVTGWYGFPNAVGLFLAPLIPLALYLLKSTFSILKSTWLHGYMATLSYVRQDKKNNTVTMLQCNNVTLPFIGITAALFIPLSLLAIVYAKSTGGLIGVAAGIGVLLLLRKKTRWPAIIIGLIGLFSIFSLSSLSGLRQELTFQDRSGQIRIAMWKEATELLKDRPILGAGLTSYTKRAVPYHKQVNGENIEIFHHPHNIFLTIWVNLGILGLIGFLLILVWFYKTGITLLQCNNVTIFLLSSMTVLLVTGLVDSPYIKNDLALFFWLLVALMYTEANTVGKKGDKIYVDKVAAP